MINYITNTENALYVIFVICDRHYHYKYKCHHMGICPHLLLVISGLQPSASYTTSGAESQQLIGAVQKSLCLPSVS